MRKQALQERLVILGGVYPPKGLIQIVGVECAAQAPCSAGPIAEIGLTCLFV